MKNLREYLIEKQLLQISKLIIFEEIIRDIHKLYILPRELPDKDLLENFHLEENQYYEDAHSIISELVSKERSSLIENDFEYTHSIVSFISRFIFITKMNKKNYDKYQENIVFELKLFYDFSNRENPIIQEILKGQ